MTFRWRQIIHNPIAQKFNTVSLLKFAFPTTMMMMVMSLYTIVDGMFVSNFVGENAFSAINIVFPFMSIVIAIGTMFSTGGNAVIAKNLGEGRNDEAKENLTLIVIISTLIGVVIMIIGILFTEEISALLGSTPVLDEYCHDYLLILSIFSPVFIWQVLAQIFFVTVGRPKLGLAITIASGVANIAFDYLFIVVFPMGIAGAALGTGLGSLISGAFFVFYFMFSKKEILFFKKTKWNGRTLLNTCTNGSSELITQLSAAVITILFNYTILEYAGEQGVAAIGIILYAQYLLMSVFLGYSIGVSPIFSFAYGSNDHAQTKKVFKVSIRFIIISSFAIFALSMFFSDYLIRIFVERQSEVFALAQNGFTLFSFSFLFMGINVFASALFTSLSNGKISATISFLRTFVFIAAFILILPRFIGINGVWLAVPLAEFVTLFISIIFFVKQRKRYNY